MNMLLSSPSVAVIGAGIAGAACAAGLHGAGWQVSVFDKARGVGGRMSTRRVRWTEADGSEQTAEFDHGAQHFSARHPRFRAAMARAEAAGVLARWRPRVHAAWSGAAAGSGLVALPGMPALCSHVLGALPVATGRAIQRLERDDAGWLLVMEDGERCGPFDHIALAMPPAQAAALLSGPHEAWAESLGRMRMLPCWTLMAVTDEPDWPWDAAEPDRGPLAWVVRNDRKPGRGGPAGRACWVAQASATWSSAHLEETPEDVSVALRDALAALLPRRQSLRWQHVSVHRWRYAAPMSPMADGADAWWDGERGIGVCGDFLGAGNVEAAWRSGDELADTMAAWLDSHPHSVQANEGAVAEPA